MTTTADIQCSTEKPALARPSSKPSDSGPTSVSDPVATAEPRRGRPRKDEIRLPFRYGIPVELVGGAPVALAKSYSERGDLLIEEDYWLHDFLFTTRLATKRRIAEALDPIAHRYEELPDNIKPKLSTVELERRREKARDQASRLVKRSELLGWVEITKHVRANQDSDKARALVQSRDEKVLGRRPDLVYLSRDGVRRVKERLGFEPDDAPTFASFERAHSAQLAHELASTDLYIDLLAYRELGLIELIAYAVEYSWLDELAIGGDPRSTKQRRPLRTDVVVTVAPPGRRDLAEVICVEIDRGTQHYTRPYPGLNPSASLVWKLEQYWKLAKLLDKVPKRGAQFVPSRLNLAFVVPPYSRIKAATRAKWHAELYQAEKVRQSLGSKKDLVELLPMPDPTPANFARALAAWLQRKAKDTPKAAA